MDNDQQTAYRDGYPQELSSAEEELVNISRQGRGKPATELQQATGVALSGGGIRSATFCLGVFQGLATLRMLSSIDFLSSVSGGGYFGSFYTRLFLRNKVTDFAFVEDTLATCPGRKKRDAYQRNVLNWLRENGRYLSPRGSGDLLLFGAVILRNWLVTQIVLAVFFLFLFLTAQAIRIPIDCCVESGMLVGLPGQLKLWLSPLMALPLLLFIFWAVPTGWAYWMVGRQPPKTEFWKRPITGMMFVSVAAVMVIALCLLGFIPDSSASLAAAGVVLLVSLLTAVWVFAAGSRHTPAMNGEKNKAAFEDEAARHWVSTQLKGALLSTAVALAVAFLDSLAQTVYLVILTPEGLKGWAGGFLAAVVAVVPFASRIMISFGGRTKRSRPKTLTKILASVAAILVATILLTAISVGANAIAWGGKRPAYAPVGIGELEPQKLSEIKVIPDRSEPNKWKLYSDGQAQAESGDRNYPLLAASWLLTLGLSFLFGQSWPFLNRSTQLPLYSARLIRAYLGASNPRRFEHASQGEHEGGAVTRVIPGDDIDADGYWPWPSAPGEKNGELAKRRAAIYAKGTPLHLVNVTINETVDGKSQVQQQDRKGVGMAVGPAGISGGVRHHAVFVGNQGLVSTFPRHGFRMFSYPKAAELSKMPNPQPAQPNQGPEPGKDAEVFQGERLPLGQILSISGAAFSTGIGSRTNLALSLLCGIGNVRLGYWWNSGVEPAKRRSREKPPLSQKAGGIFTKVFPVQSYLLDEYTARFHGSARKHWYLSDGGHFENMGGYELIRRRLRVIMIIDAEADPDYKFGGLGNLIRKARIDFGAEIHFLDDDELEAIKLPDSHKGLFRSLEGIRRGIWVEEHIPAVGNEAKTRETIDPVDHTRHSLAHAALATVSYDGKCDPESCIIYLKPSIVGDEPRDVLQYHVEHPEFPHETTADQFFDEAQWESYRTLGEHVAEKVLQPPEGGERSLEWLADLVLKSGGVAKGGERKL